METAIPIYMAASDIHFGRLTIIIISNSISVGESLESRRRHSTTEHMNFIFCLCMQNPFRFREQIGIDAVPSQSPPARRGRKEDGGANTQTEFVAENSNEMKWQNLIRCQKSYPTSVSFGDLLLLLLLLLCQ